MRASQPRMVIHSIQVPCFRAHTLAVIAAVFGPLVHQDKVRSVIATLSVDGPKANLEKFTSFRTRCKRFSLDLTQFCSNLGAADYRSDVSSLNGPFSIWFVTCVVDREAESDLVVVQDRGGAAPAIGAFDPT